MNHKIDIYNIFLPQSWNLGSETILLNFRLFWNPKNRHTGNKPVIDNRASYYYIALSRSFSLIQKQNSKMIQYSTFSNFKELSLIKYNVLTLMYRQDGTSETTVQNLFSLFSFIQPSDHFIQRTSGLHLSFIFCELPCTVA